MRLRMNPITTSLPANRQEIGLATVIWSVVFGLAVFSMFFDGTTYRAPVDGRWIVLASIASILGVAISMVLPATFTWLRRWGWWSFLLLALVVAIAHAALDALVQNFVVERVFGLRTNSVSFGIIVNSVNLLAPHIVFIIGSELLRSGALLRRQTEDLMASRQTAQEAHLAALRYQINPHFLFNALNAITSLIVAGRNQDAEQATTMLGDFMRGSLEVEPENFVPLGQEIDSVAAYVAIEKIRFGSRLSVTFDVADDLMALSVPPLLIQPLLENAVKHGLGATTDPVLISVSVIHQDGEARITVANEALGIAQIGRASGKSGTGTGLVNIRSRLAALYGQDGRLETTTTPRGFTAAIVLPA